DQPQIGQRITNLGALIETKTTYYSIVEADCYKTVFDFPRLELRTHEDRHPVERSAFAFQPLDLIADAACFFGTIPDADDANFVAAAALGPQRFAQSFAIAVDQARRRGQNIRRRAIVLLKPD